MNNLNNINILIAEDNEISRELMSSILKTQGYNIIMAADGDEAINALDNNAIDLALVDLNMLPKGGFDFIRYLVVNSIKIPVIIVTADNSSDVLMRANELGVTRVLQKPVEPDRLISTAQQILKRYGHNLNVIASQSYETIYSENQLMQRANDIAEKNAKSGKGGPFGAVIANEKGEILGEGANGITSRIDPTAHAEIMAIRQAAEKLGRSNLSDCVLYCSSEPTMMGQALITSVGIVKVYYGLSHTEINNLRSKHKHKKTEYIQLGHEHAIKMFKRWEAIDKEKLTD